MGVTHNRQQRVEKYRSNRGEGTNTLTDQRKERDHQTKQRNGWDGQYDGGNAQHRGRQPFVAYNQNAQRHADNDGQAYSQRHQPQML